ncbi:MAG: hypothetical protein IT440_09465 [Phycisphaeraceae bacterium]|nr:hypothetical protein [Phycisphaeraceae bacterium]
MAMLASAGPGMADLGLVAMLLVGMLLALMGRKLAKVICAVAGMAVGGVFALSLPGIDAHQAALPVFVVTGCAVGFAAAWSLFRAFAGLFFGLMLAASIPAVNLAMHHEPLPPLLTPGEIASFSAADVSINPRQRLLEHARNQSQAWTQWWSGLPEDDQKRVMGLAILGAMAGLFFGVIAPYTVASLASSAVGAAMLVYPGLTLLDHFGPSGLADKMGAGNGPMLAAGLITLLGAALQWMIWRRKADK